MKISIAAAGDMLIQRRINQQTDEFNEVKNLLNNADARFINLETTVHDGQFFANRFSGGSYLRISPETLDDVKAYGFNILSFANNHSMDFSHLGLMETKKHVDNAGFVNAGAGANLDEAAAPNYLETKNGRVAIISVVSTMDSTIGSDEAIAGKQSRRFIGRPGVNGLRIDEHLEVTKEQFDIIKEVATLSKINAQTDIERAEGYHPPLKEGTINLKNIKFNVSDKTRYITHPNEKDMLRIEKAINVAKQQADCILISVHSHEISGDKKENPADFLVEFAHKCIDAGANAVIGHGPHLLRPVEIYNNCPIFYSLGDFVIHNECIPFAPEDMYASQGLTSDDTMPELFKKRSNNFTRGLMRDRRMLESVIANFDFEDGKINNITLTPIELNFDKAVWQSGNPRISYSHGIIERLSEMSKAFNTKIELDEKGNGIIKI